MGESCYVGVGSEWLGADEGHAAGMRAVAARSEESLWYPGAARKPIPRNFGGPLSSSRGLVLHVQEGRSSLRGWFSRPEARSSSHWWVGADGTVEQYVPADRVAWAQGAGNAAWHSVETAGYIAEPLTGPQIAALAGLYRWGRVHWSWPFQLAEKPLAYGLGWHGMGAPAWGHAECPGVIRRGQRGAILDLAEGDGDDVTEQDKTDIANKVLAALRVQVFEVQPPIRQGNAGNVIGATYNKVGDVQSRLSSVLTLVSGLAEGDVREIARGLDDPETCDRLAVVFSARADELRRAAAGG